MKARINLVQYSGKHLVRPLVESFIRWEFKKSCAILVRTNYEALIVSSHLEELGYKTRLLAGFEGFSTARLDEVRFMTKSLNDSVNESGLIYESDWVQAIESFKEKYRSTPHYLTCLEIFKKFNHSYPDRKLLLDWFDYIREIKMEDAIHAESDSVIISTMHKAKGREFNHVWLLLEDYNISTDETKRLVYVACSRAKDSLHIHTNGSFFNSISVKDLMTTKYEGDTFPPSYYELILNHKEVNLNSQKFPRARRIINRLETGNELSYNAMRFGETEAPGLFTKNGNMLLFSKEFIDKKLLPFKSRGYELVHARVEYLVYWYDRDEDKEYKVVLPRLRFEMNEE